MALSPYMTLERSRFFNFLCAQKGDKMNPCVVLSQERMMTSFFIVEGGVRSLF